MSTKRIKHLAACAGLSLVVTAITVAVDSQRQEIHQTMEGLRWSRQVATQAEGMIFDAREKGERDPIGWTVNYLAQGVEPRLVRVSRVQVSDSSAQNTENYSRDGATGTFEYTRIFAPEGGVGIRIVLSQSYVGFFGTRTPFASDCLAIALFAVCFALTFFASGRFFGFDDARKLRLLVSHWVHGAKGHLIRHGSHVRDMVRDSQRLAVSAGRARLHVEGLRSNIHAGLTELHENRDFYREGEAVAARAETLALNMAIEANRLGGDARRIADMATELHRKLQSLNAVNRRGQILLERIERKIEPWSTDADLAFHAFDEVKQTTESLGTHIRSTTESLLSQARLIQNLNRELGASDFPMAPVASHEPPEAEDPEQEPLGRETVTTSRPRLPDPLPPISDRETQPRIARKLRVLGRKLRHRKSV